MTVDETKLRGGQQSHQVCLRVDDDLLRLWNELPALKRSEVLVKLVKHALRCPTASEEFKWDFSLAAQQILWPPKDK